METTIVGLYRDYYIKVICRCFCNGQIPEPR